MAHLGSTVEERQKQLNEQLERIQAENDQLVVTLAKQRKEMEATVGSVEAVIADLDASLTSLPTQDMQNLSRDAVALDNELGGGE